MRLKLDENLGHAASDPVLIRGRIREYQEPE